MFQTLDKADQMSYRQAARENYNPNVDPNISGVWHPVYRDECFKIKIEWLVANNQSTTDVLRLKEENESLMQYYIL